MGLNLLQLSASAMFVDKLCMLLAGGIVNNTLRPQIPTWCDPEWKSLMQSCWAPDPSERPSFSEISQKLRSMAAAMNVKWCLRQITNCAGLMSVRWSLIFQVWKAGSYAAFYFTATMMDYNGFISAGSYIILLCVTTIHTVADFQKYQKFGRAFPKPNVSFLLCGWYTYIVLLFYTNSCMRRSHHETCLILGFHSPIIETL